MNENGTEPGRWWLCSHLVRIEREESTGPAETAVLEEIRDEGARVAVEDPYGLGRHLRVEADGFAQKTVVVACSRRETDYLMELEFTDEFRWTPDAWAPQHLYLPEVGKSKAKRASSNQ